MKRPFLSLAILFIGIIFISCAAKSTPAENTFLLKPASSESQIPVKEAWRAEWDRLLLQGRKEGKAVLVSTNSPEVRNALTHGFRNAAGLELEVITGRGSEVAQRLLTERRAGLYSVDAYLGGGTTLISQIKPADILESLRPIIFLPEILEPEAWYQKFVPWFDDEKSFIIFPLSNPSGGTDIVFNKTLLKMEPVISYHDLLDPKLKKKMIFQDPTSAGRGNTWFFWALYIDGMDMEYMKALASQEPVITRNERDMLDGVSQGKYLVAIAPDVSLVRDYIAAGAPVEGRAFKESKPKISPHSGYIALLKNAPHPAAAKLFINWYLSREGQTIMSRAYPTQSARVDVPNDHLKPEDRLDPNLNYIYPTEYITTKSANAIRQAQEVFGYLVR